MLNYLHKILAKALLGVLVFGVVGCSGSIAISDLRSGDLLFVVNGQGNNITDVTDGVDGLGIDHVAVFSDGNVIEAIPEYGVVENPLDSFLVRLSDRESVLVGRIEGLDVEESVANARKFLGRPYDDIFMPSDSAIYCSELVQKSFVFKDGQKERDHNVKGIAVEATMACDEHKRLKLTIDPSAVLYVSAEANYINIHYLENDRVKTYQLRNSMKSLETDALKHGFVRCHRSYYVNPRHIKVLSRDKDGVIYTEFIRDGVGHIPVSKQYYDNLAKLL